MSDDRLSALLASYPRVRPELTPAHERIFAEQYRINRDGSEFAENMAQRLERWMHNRVAGVSGGPILGLGAGTLNHRQYEPLGAEYDVVEPFHDLFRARPEARYVIALFYDVSEIPLHQPYHWIISVAVLEHDQFAS